MLIQSKREVQQIMSNYVGIVRSNLSLKRAMRRLEILYEETEELYNKTKPNRELCELRNMIAVAYLVIKQGRESRSRWAATTTWTTRRPEARGLYAPQARQRRHEEPFSPPLGGGERIAREPLPGQYVADPEPPRPDHP